MKILRFIRLSLVLALCSISLGVIQAEDTSAFLTFERTDGTSVSLTSDNLSISFESGNLVADNGTESVTLALSEVSRFYFAAASGLQDPAVAATDEDYCIYDTKGVLIAKVTELSDCSTQLSAGVYIAKSSTKTIKVIVK